MVADTALHSRFKLAIEKIHKNGPVSLQKSVPKVLCDYFIRSTIRILLFDVRLFLNLVAIFVQGFKQNG
jgi:hypothetical protein